MEKPVLWLLSCLLNRNQLSGGVQWGYRSMQTWESHSFTQGLFKTKGVPVLGRIKHWQNNKKAGSRNSRGAALQVQITLGTLKQSWSRCGLQTKHFRRVCLRLSGDSVSLSQFYWIRSSTLLISSALKWLHCCTEVWIGEGNTKLQTVNQPYLPNYPLALISEPL